MQCGVARLRSVWSTIRWCCFFFSSRRRHTRLQGDWSSDVCSSDLICARWPRGAAALRESAQRLARNPQIRNFDLPFLCETARYLPCHEQSVSDDSMEDRKSVV